METTTCESVSKSAVEQLREIINLEFSLTPEIDEEPNASKDTPFSLFGMYFSGVEMFYHGLKNPNNKEARFTEEQQTFIEAEFADIKSVILFLKDHDFSTEINEGRRAGDLPLKEAPEKLLEGLYGRVRSIPDAIESL